MLGSGPRLLVGVTSQAATRLGPGWVKHAGEGPTLIGFWTSETRRPRQLARFFADAGLAATSVPDIDHWVWQKLAVNAAINGLTALGDISNGAVATTPSC